MNALPQIIECHQIPLARPVVVPIEHLSPVPRRLTKRLRRDHMTAKMEAPDYLLEEAGMCRGLNESYSVGVVLKRIVKRKRA